MVRHQLNRDWSLIARLGTSNGLARCLECDQPELAVLNIIKGHTKQLDVIRLIQEGSDPRFGFLMFTHGIIADTDMESEKYRWAGIARNSIGGLQRICWLRRYNVSFWYKPVPEEVVELSVNKMVILSRKLPNNRQTTMIKVQRLELLITTIQALCTSTLRFRIKNL